MQDIIQDLKEKKIWNTEGLLCKIKNFICLIIGH